MSAPTIIAGPCILKWNNNIYATEGDVSVKLVRETWKPGSSLIGEGADRLTSQRIEISFTPYGMLDVVAKYLPYTLADIGGSIFGAVPKPLQIIPRVGKKVTYPMAAITASPGLKPAATNALYSSNMTFTCLGDPTKERTDAAAWATLATEAFAYTGFNRSKVLSPRYLAAWGDTAPFDSMESQDGFTIAVPYSFDEYKVNNWGLVDMYLTNIAATASFIPVGFDVDDFYDLLALQGAGALLPGESVSKADNDLIISGGGASFTLHKAGPLNGESRYGKALRLGEIGFVAEKDATAGVMDALFTFAFPA